ncbi:MAG: hypothetical protein ABSG68_26950 [Thermoguttaceae bacterium]
MAEPFEVHRGDYLPCPPADLDRRVKWPPLERGLREVRLLFKKDAKNHEITIGVSETTVAGG